MLLGVDVGEFKTNNSVPASLASQAVNLSPELAAVFSCHVHRILGTAWSLIGMSSVSTCRAAHKMHLSSKASPIHKAQDRSALAMLLSLPKSTASLASKAMVLAFERTQSHCCVRYWQPQDRGCLPKQPDTTGSMCTGVHWLQEPTVE